MSPVLAPLYRLHGRLALRGIMRGDGRPSFALRSVRLILDFAEMGQVYGWRGVVDVVRDRLGVSP